MPFNTLDHRPENSQAAHVGDIAELQIDGSFIIEMPDVEFINREIAYWINVLDNGVFDGRPDFEGIGMAIQKVLSGLKERMSRFENNAAHKSGQIDDIVNVAHMVYTQQQLASLLGLSQLLQVPEIAELLRGAKLPQPEDEEPEERGYLMVDNGLAEHEKAGLHLDPYFMAALSLPVPETKHDQWYEGGGVYMRAHRPAHLTRTMEGMFQRKGATLLDRLALTSLAGRVKLPVWRGEVV